MESAPESNSSWKKNFNNWHRNYLFRQLRVSQQNISKASPLAAFSIILLIN